MDFKQKIKKVFIHLRYKELRALPGRAQDDATHLRAAIEWLCTAQDAVKKGVRDGGVSAAYDLWKGGWQQSYRETTGYIIETFLEYYRHTKDKRYLERAICMGDWELSVQCEDGAVGEIKKDGSIGKKIFNTGQVLLGFIALYKETESEKYLRAARKGADWIVNNQDVDGGWGAYTMQGSNREPKTFHSRVAWPLLLLYHITNEQKYRDSALHNIVWILMQQQSNYWFGNVSLTESPPWTHVIAYTINGLLECYPLLDAPDDKLLRACYGAADVVLQSYKQHGGALLAGSFDGKWKPDTMYSCLTGNAQMSIVWMQLYQLTGEKKFLEGACKILEQTKTTQFLSGRKELRGGIPGSYPIDGNYGPYQLPNWAPKFFADALMMKARI